VGGLTNDQTDAALTTAGSRLIAYRWASLLSVVVNQRRRPRRASRPGLRTGLLAAIDRNSLVTKVLEGRGSYADLPIPSWSPAYDSGSVNATPYSVSDAEGYLATAGWQQSSAGWTAPKATTTYSMELLTLDEASNPLVYQTAVQVADAWRAVGLNVQLEAVSTGVYMDRLNTGLFEFGDRRLRGRTRPGPGADAPVDASGFGWFERLGRAGHIARPTPAHGAQDGRSGCPPGCRLGSREVHLDHAADPALAFRDYDLVVSSRVYDIVSNEIADRRADLWDVIDWRLASDR